MTDNEKPLDFSTLFDRGDLLRLTEEPKHAAISFLITLAQKERLREMGYSDAAIFEMAPAKVHAILDTKKSG